MSIRPRLDPEVVATFKRRRIIAALAELCAERGYRATTIAHIAGLAEISRTTFYEQFENREQAMLNLLDCATAELLERTETACRAATESESRIEAGLAAVLKWVAEEPTVAWAFFVESLCATPAALGRHLEAINRFTTLLHDAAPSDVPRPESTEESLVGGVLAILSGVIRRGEAGAAPQYLPELTVFLEGPFLTIGSKNQQRDR